MNRRRFLRYVAGSPIYTAAAQLGGQTGGKMLPTAAEALEVFDFLAPAEKNIQSQHWAYMMGGSDDDATVRANQQGYEKFRILARRHEDVTALNTSVTLFGQKLAHPILLAPAAGHQAFHPDGEAATARGAAAKKAQMILSTNSSLHVKQVAREFGSPLWFQLYTQADFAVTRALVQRAEDAGCTAMAITVDSITRSNHVTADRAGRKTEQRCRPCHGTTQADYFKEHGNYEGLSPGTESPLVRTFTWPAIERVRALTKMKVLVKGVTTPEDAAACVRAGVDGIIVSNHGGRQENSLNSTIEALPGIAQTVNGRLPILIDGGIRRGTDIFKALALGANAVCIGRPYIWGLGAFGQAGVERVLEILLMELAAIMRLSGVASVRHLSPLCVARRG